MSTPTATNFLLNGTDLINILSMGVVPSSYFTFVSTEGISYNTLTQTINATQYCIISIYDTNNTSNSTGLFKQGTITFNVDIPKMYYAVIGGGGGGSNGYSITTPIYTVFPNGGGGASGNYTTGYCSVNSGDTFVASIANGGSGSNNNNNNLIIASTGGTSYLNLPGGSSQVFAYGGNPGNNNSLGNGGSVGGGNGASGGSGTNDTNGSVVLFTFNDNNGNPIYTTYVSGGGSASSSGYGGSAGIASSGGGGISGGNSPNGIGGNTILPNYGCGGGGVFFGSGNSDTSGNGAAGAVIFVFEAPSVQANTTNYLYNTSSGYQDLNTLFTPQLVNPGTNYIATNFLCSNYTPLWSTTTTPGTYDLGQIFVNNYYKVTGNYSISYNSSYTTIVTFNYSSSTNSTIIFFFNGTINCTATGGGGKGGNGSSSGYGGGGGGGGGTVIETYNIVYNQIYTISVGSSGQNSSLYLGSSTSPSIIVEGYGGENGNNGTSSGSGTGGNQGSGSGATGQSASGSIPPGYLYIGGPGQTGGSPGGGSGGSGYNNYGTGGTGGTGTNGSTTGSQGLNGVVIISFNIPFV